MALDCLPRDQGQIDRLPGDRESGAAEPGELQQVSDEPLEAADLPHAFERFYLHNRYRSERPVGSGLGLAIVAGLVSAIGGRVRASSPTDGGAEFVVELPIDG